MQAPEILRSGRSSGGPTSDRFRRLLTAIVTALLAAAPVGGGGGGDAPPKGEPPATTTTTTAPHDPGPERPLEVTKEAAAGLPGYNVHRPTDLDAAGAPLPVVVWANGGCFRHDATWEPVFREWAAAGYVVVSITTPADGGDPREAGQSTAADQARAIDWAEAQTGDDDGPFAGRLDLDAVIAAGNSCGGITSLALAGEDERVDAAFVLSGSSTMPGATPEATREAMSGIAVPVGYIVGGPEDIASTMARQDYDALAEGVPAFVASRFEADHVTVSTDPDILAEVAEISTAWFDLVVRGDETARAAVAGNPCASCDPETWTSVSKHLDALPIG